GALVADVVPKSPAAKAGVQSGDVVIAVDGDEVDSAEATVEAVGKKKTGEEVALKIFRDGKNVELKVKLEAIKTFAPKVAQVEAEVEQGREMARRAEQFARSMRDEAGRRAENRQEWAENFQKLEFRLKKIEEAIASMKTPEVKPDVAGVEADVEKQLRKIEASIEALSNEVKKLTADPKTKVREKAAK
ncbi:MAG: S1C family serine protease, partial [Planctomycetia bacterium]